MIYLVTSERAHFRSQEEQHQLGLYLLRLGLWRTAGLAPGAAGLRRSRRGKPYLAERPDIQFSIAHCPGGAAVAIASRRTGIDIERVRPHAEPAARKALSAEELQAVRTAADPDRAFFRLWTLKESYLKALGTGMALPLNRICFEVGPDLSVTCSRRGCRFRLIESDHGYITAVCHLESQDMPDLADDPLVIWELP